MRLLAAALALGLAAPAYAQDEAPTPMWAIIESCYVGADGPGCVLFVLNEPFRTLSDCLIAIEQVDQALRQIRSRLSSGACTDERPVAEGEPT